MEAKQLNRLFYTCRAIAVTMLMTMIAANAAERPHVVFITLDDMSRSSVGAYGCKVPEITPNMDRLAKEGMRFNHFHVMASNCTPSRSHMMTGQYQQHNLVLSLGSEGAGNHHNSRTMPAIFRNAGYHTGIMGKNSHQMPFEPHSAWDVEYDGYGSTRFPSNVYEKTKAAVADAKRLNKPLFFNLNIFDPHQGWYGWNNKTGPKKETENHPSRIYQPDEIPYPHFFPPVAKSGQVGATKSGTPNVSMQQELAAYYNTVKRADDSIGQSLRALEEGGILKNTVIVLISDHGMQQPGAKTTLYHEGTVSPLLVRWPGVVEPQSVNDSHILGAVDLVPTFCELIGQPIPHDVDGRSFLPLIHQKQLPNWRDYVYKQQNDRNKGRGIQTKKWLYLVNPWSDGVKKFSSVSTGVHCWTLFKKAAANVESSQLLKDWVHRIEFRAPEELFDVENDPGCLHNLAKDPDYAEALKKMRDLMLAEATAGNDHLFLDCIRAPNDPKAMAKTVATIDAFREARKHAPEAARQVHFDPLDGWTVLGHTMFEPFGEWGIWQAVNNSAALSKSAGSDTSGPACVQFTTNGILRTTKAYRGDNFSKLKLEFQIPKPTTPKKGKRKKTSTAQAALKISNSSALVIEIGDQDNWQELARITGKKLIGNHQLILPRPPNGFPASAVIRLRAVLADQERFFLDGLRLTAQQDWQTAFTNHSVSVSNGSTIALPSVTTTKQMGDQELRYHFRGEKITPNDRLVLEQSINNQWTPVIEHRFGHVIQPNTTYEGLETFTSDTANNPLRFRLISKAGTAKISNATLRWRPRTTH